MDLDRPAESPDAILPVIPGGDETTDESLSTPTDHPMVLDVEDQVLIAGGVAHPIGRFAPTAAPTWPLVTNEGVSPWSRLSSIWQRSLRLPASVSLIGLLVYVFAFNLSVVRGSSMAPGIHDGDRILIDHISHHFTSIERGDIVVLAYPLDPELDYIKRVIGVPGDEIVLAGGHLWINGELQEEPYLKELDPYTHLVERVSPGQYFVLGDNRLHSSDSREFGQVDADLIRGRVDLRLWPPARIGRVL